MNHSFIDTPLARRTAAPLQPLEAFLRDYVEQSGGAWDEIEPQVYDFIVDDDAVRVAFDTEAIAEHPAAQLASLGSPLMDRLLEDARHRGAFTVLYAGGLNTRPYDLPGRLRRAYSTGPGVELAVTGVRLCFFPQALYGFVATFVSDRKEQSALEVALDLHSGREVRHLSRIISGDELSGVPAESLPEAPHQSVRSGFNLALEQVARSLSPLANHRRRELKEYTGRHIERVSRYYAKMLEELEQQPQRGASEAEAQSRHAARSEAIDRERVLRITELRQKSVLQVCLALTRVQVIHLPKLLVKFDLTDPRGRAVPCQAVFDLRSDLFEPVLFGGGRLPTFDLSAAFH